MKTLYEVMDGSSKDEEKLKKAGEILKAGVLIEEHISEAADHAYSASVAQNADDKACDKSYPNRSSHRTGAAFGEDEKCGECHEDNEQYNVDGGHYKAFKLVLVVYLGEREALVDEVHADEYADGKADYTCYCVEVTACKSQNHTQGAAQEHEGADHDEKAEDKACEGGGASLGLVLFHGNRHYERAENETYYLGSHILYCLCSVKTESTGSITDKAGYTEAHVSGVSHFDEDRGKDADYKACNQNEKFLFLFAVHTFTPLFSGVSPLFIDFFYNCQRFSLSLVFHKNYIYNYCENTKPI